MEPIMDYARQNPSASAQDIIKHFEDVMEIPRQVQILKTEVDETRRFKGQLRPTYAKRMEVEEKMKYAMSDIEVEIFMEYPPRKGSEAQREALRDKLKAKNPQYLELRAQYDAFTRDIQDLEDELKLLEMGSKAARRLTELFGQYMTFITEQTKR